MAVSPIHRSNALSDNNATKISSTSGKEEEKKLPKNRKELIQKAQEYGLLDEQWNPKAVLRKTEMPPLNDEESAEILEKLFEPFDIFIFDHWIRISWGELLIKFLEKISKDGGITINERICTEEGKIQWVGKQVALKITSVQIIGSYAAHILFKTGYAGRRLEKMGEGDLYQEKFIPKHLLDPCEDMDLRLHFECDYENDYLILKEIRNIFVDILCQHFVTVHTFAKPRHSVLVEAFKALAIVFPGKSPEKTGADKNCFLNFSIKGSPIDCSVEKSLNRKYVFGREDTYIAIENLFSEDGKMQFIPKSHSERGALGILHAYLGLIHAEQIDTIDDKGLFRLHTLMAKGEILKNSKLEGRILGQASTTLSRSPNEIQKWVEQHFSKNPIYILSFFFRAFQFTEEQAPLLFPQYRKFLKEADFSFSKTSGGELLQIVYTILYENSHHHSLIADVLNLASFLATPSAFVEIEELSEEMMMVKVASSDAKKESSCAFLIEIDILQAIKNIAAYEQKHRDGWEKIESQLSALFFLFCSAMKKNATYPDSKPLIKEAKAILVEKSGPFSKFLALSLLLTLSSSEKEKADLFFTYLPEVFQTMRKPEEAEYFLSLGEELLKEPGALTNFAKEAGKMDKALQREADLEHSKLWCIYLLNKKKEENHPIDLQETGIKIFKKILKSNFEKEKLDFALELIETLCATFPEKALSLFIALKSKTWLEIHPQESLKSIIECVRILAKSDHPIKKELSIQFGSVALMLLQKAISDFDKKTELGLARLVLDLTDERNDLALKLIEMACEKGFICEGPAYYKCWIAVLKQHLQLSAYATFEFWDSHLKGKERVESLELLLNLSQKLLSEAKTEDLGVCLDELRFFEIPEKQQEKIESLFSHYAKIKKTLDQHWPISPKCKEKLNLELLEDDLNKEDFSRAVVRFRQLCKERDFPDSYHEFFDKLFLKLLTNCKYDLARKLVQIALDEKKHTLEQSLLYLKQILEKGYEDTELLLALLDKERHVPEATRIQIAKVVIELVEKEAIFQKSYLFKCKVQLEEAFARYFSLLEEKEPALLLRCVKQCYIKDFSLQRTASNARAWFAAMKASDSERSPLFTSAVKLGFFQVEGIREKQIEIIGLMMENAKNVENCESCLQILFSYPFENEFKESWIAVAQKGIVNIRENQPLQVLHYLDILSEHCLEWSIQQANVLMIKLIKENRFEDLASWLNKTTLSKDLIRQLAYVTATAWLKVVDAIPQDDIGSGKTAILCLMKLLKNYALRDEPGTFLWQKLIFLACLHAPDKSWELFKYVSEQQIFETAPAIMQGVLLATLTGLRAIHSEILKRLLKDNSEFDLIFHSETENIDRDLLDSAYHTLIFGALSLLKKEKDKESFFELIEARFARFKSLGTTIAKKAEVLAEGFSKIPIISDTTHELQQSHLEIAMMTELLKGYSPQLRIKGEELLKRFVSVAVYHQSLVPLINLLFKKYNSELENECIELLKTVINAPVTNLDYKTIIDQLIKMKTALSIYLGAVLLLKAYESDFKKDPDAWKCLFTLLETLRNLRDVNATENFKQVFRILETEYADQLHLPEYKIEYLLGKLTLNLAVKDKTDRKESLELMAEMLTAIPLLLEQKKNEELLIAAVSLLLKISFFSVQNFKKSSEIFIKRIMTVKNQKTEPLLLSLRINLVIGLNANLKKNHPYKSELADFAISLREQLCKDFPQRQTEIDQAIPFEQEPAPLLFNSFVLHTAAKFQTIRTELLKNMQEKDEAPLSKSVNEVLKNELMLAKLDPSELLTLYYGIIQISDKSYHPKNFYALSTHMFSTIPSELRPPGSLLYGDIPFLRLCLFLKLFELSNITNAESVENKDSRFFVLCNLQATLCNIEKDFFPDSAFFSSLLNFILILTPHAALISQFYEKNPEQIKKDKIPFVPIPVLLDKITKKNGQLINSDKGNRRLLEEINKALEFQQKNIKEKKPIDTDSKNFYSGQFFLQGLITLNEKVKTYQEKFELLQKTVLADF